MAETRAKAERALHGSADGIEVTEDSRAAA